MNLKTLIPILGGLPLIAIPFLCAADSDDGFVSLFDGKTLKGWHVSAKTGHSGTSKHKSGGRWVVEDGAITGSQDIPGNGGIVITDEQFGDFEVSIEMKNDFGPDSGLFLRSTEDGKAWQAMIDYHKDGNLMGIYGEGLGGQPHVRNYNFKDKVTEIEEKKAGPTSGVPISGTSCELASLEIHLTSPPGSMACRSWNGRRKRFGTRRKVALPSRCMAAVITPKNTYAIATSA